MGKPTTRRKPMERGQQKLLFGELKRNKRERFQEVVGEVMCAVVLMLFFGILIYAPVLFVGLVN
tara:strand:+ start:1338 stop:1529 length:192 start_codon:yes stop_codon:yes gene_type:complete